MAGVQWTHMCERLIQKSLRNHQTLLTSLATHMLTFPISHKALLPEAKWPSEIWALNLSSWLHAPPMQQLLHTISFLPKSPLSSYPMQYTFPVFKRRVRANHPANKDRAEGHQKFQGSYILQGAFEKRGRFQGLKLQRQHSAWNTAHTVFRTAPMGWSCSQEQSVERVIMC